MQDAVDLREPFDPMSPGATMKGHLPPPDSQELSEYKSYLTANPDDSEVRRDYAMRLYQSRNVRGSCEQLKHLVRADPADAGSRSLLAYYLKEAGSIKESESHFKYLIRRRPETGNAELDNGIFAEAFWNLHQLEEGRGNKRLSRRYREKAVEFAPRWMIRDYGMLESKPKRKE